MFIQLAVGIERQFGFAHWSWVDVDQINARIGQLGELFQIVAAIDDAGVQQRRRTSGLPRCRGRHFRFAGGNPIFCHGRTLPGQGISRKPQGANLGHGDPCGSKQRRPHVIDAATCGVVFPVRVLVLIAGPAGRGNAYRNGRNSTRSVMSGGSYTLAINSKSRTAWPMVIAS